MSFKTKYCRAAACIKLLCVCIVAANECGLTWVHDATFANKIPLTCWLFPKINGSHTPTHTTAQYNGLLTQYSVLASIETRRINSSSKPPSGNGMAIEAKTEFSIFRKKTTMESNALTACRFRPKKEKIPENSIWKTNWKTPLIV